MASEWSKTNMKKRSYVFALLTCVLLSLVACNETSSTRSRSSSSTLPIPTNPGKIFDDSEIGFTFRLQEMVGPSYGDSLFFKIGDYDILCDGGNSEDAAGVSATLNKYCTDHVLDMLILTHPHDDHVGSFTRKSTFTNGGISSIGTIIDDGIDSYSSDSSYWASLRDSYVAAGTKYYCGAEFFGESPLHDPTFTIDSKNYVTFLNTGNYKPRGSSYSGDDLNNLSLAFLVGAGDYKFVCTGDCEINAISGIVKNYKDNPFLTASDTVIYKVGHHGSFNATNAAFLDFIRPKYGLISAAITEENRTKVPYPASQHPHRQTTDLLRNYTDQVYWNGINGSLNFCLNKDYSKCEVFGEKRTLGYFIDSKFVDAASETNIPFYASQWYRFVY